VDALMAAYCSTVAAAARRIRNLRKCPILLPIHDATAHPPLPSRRDLRTPQSVTRWFTATEGVCR